jgi:hypothetical protein
MFSVQYFHTAKETEHFTTTQINWLVLFKDAIPVKP